MSRPSGRQPGGFTLLELLVVTMIMAVVITAIGACLGGGLRVWDAAQRFGRGESEALIAMETLCGDLRNAYAFQAIGFDGSPGAVAFPGLATIEDRMEGRQRALCTVRYRLDGGNLVRETELYPKGARAAEGMASRIADLQFTYRVAGVEEFVESTTNMPRWVDVALVLAAEAEGDAPVELRRTVSLAAGAAL